jgi:hypothetical protein
MDMEQEKQNLEGEFDMPRQDRQEEFYSPSQDDKINENNYESPERDDVKEERDLFEDDLEIRQKLIDAKVAKKRADEDAKLLQNRVALLKMEEQKVTFYSFLS